MKIAIVDKIGLCYDGDTLSKRGLGGSESAVILISRELAKLGFDVTVYNNCKDGSHSRPGVYDSVRYIDNTNATSDRTVYDVVIVSRTAKPFISNDYPFIHEAKKRILWLHDTFIEGDQFVESLLVNNNIDHIFTLSDWHTNYILNAAHGQRRNYEVLKRKVFQTRNGAVQHIPEVDLKKKDRNHFVYNASATKGMVPLVENIWPEIKKRIPSARLTIIGGFYRFREGAKPDEQENTVSNYSKRQDLKDLGITFTGVLPQNKIADILSNAWMMIYPGAFPETFGISTLESLLYNTPLVTTRFGALEETAIDLTSYHIDYAIEPNSLFPHINKDDQVQKFIEKVIYAYNTPYLHQQKQNYCNIVKDIAGWDTVALQWKQFLYGITDRFLHVDEYRKVSRINDKVERVFGRVSTFPVLKQYKSYTDQRRIVVISPFWNSSNYIEKCIDSTASQDYDNYIHVLIDDNSNDDSFNKVIKKISSLPESIRNKFQVVSNKKNFGAIYNQLTNIEKFTTSDDIVMLLDGDDWLVNNNTIFHYYNDLYSQGYEFTYGSMWSVVDNIPLIAQEYPNEVKQNGSYRKHLFNWKIPYTHLRTCLSKHFESLDHDKFKDPSGSWMKSGADNPLFYELIERVDPDKIYCNQEIVCNYNDANPLNDYKIRSHEQNQNANMSYGMNKKMKKILLAIPTSKYIEVSTFKSIYDLEVPEGYKVEFQYFYGYSIDEVRNLIAEWAKRYDYLFSVDSDIVLPRDALRKMIEADKDIITGMYIQRKPGEQILEVYMDHNGGFANIPLSMIENRGIVEIAGCGMGCALIKSDVIRKMEYPHFVYKSSLTNNGRFTEDIYFCKKARDLGFKIWCDPSIRCDHVGNTKFSIDTLEEKNIQSVYNQDQLPKDHVKYLENMDVKPKVIYDIGSCVLHWTRHAHRIWPDSEIVLFEANRHVKKLYDSLPYQYHLGVLSSEDNKKIKFYCDPMNLGGNSYYKENTAHYNETHAVYETGMTLDTIVEQKKIKLPDIIKLDVQGAEIDILKGARKCLEHCTDVILEAQYTDYNIGAPKVENVIDYMQSIGFELVSNFTRNDIDGDYHFRKLQTSQ